MTASEMTARVYARIDDSTAPATATAAEVLAALNEGQELASFLTLSLVATASFTLVAGAPFYSIRAALPDFLCPLYFSTPAGRIFPATIRQLDALDSHWQATGGTPARYFTLGFNFLAISPQPTGDTVAQLTYARAPVPLVGDDFPEIPERYHQNLVDYAVWRVRLKDGQQQLARGAKYLARYMAAMKELGDATRARAAAADFDTRPFELLLVDRSHQKNKTPHA